jgi:PmbA protein
MSAGSLVEQVIERALQQGAHSAEVSFRNQESTEVSFENNQLKSTQSNQRTEIRLKVIVDRKAGISFTTDPEDLDGLVRRALEAAQFGSPVYYDMPDPAPAQEVKLYDSAVADLTRQEMVGMGTDMLEAVNEYDSEVMVGAGIQKEVYRYEFANSTGVHFADDCTSLNLGAEGVRTRGNDIFFTGLGVGSRSRKIDHAAVAQRVVEGLRLAEQNASIQSGVYPVIFTPEGTMVLMLTLVLGLNGKNVFLGESPLSKRLGEKIASERFTLLDNPLIDFSPASSRYDGEGVPRQITPLIENGVVKNFLYDLDAAAKAGARSTGNGPGPSPTNWVVQPGETSLDEMVKNTREGLLVQSVLGLGQGNPMNGEFSLNVQEGYKIEDGRLVGRVKDVMLSGNVYEALQNILAIGSQPEWVVGWLPRYMPHIQVDGLSITSKAD